MHLTVIWANTRHKMYKTKINLIYFFPHFDSLLTTEELYKPELKFTCVVYEDSDQSILWTLVANDQKVYIRVQWRLLSDYTEENIITEGLRKILN